MATIPPPKCATTQRLAGILIPQCPPKNEVEFSKSGEDGAVNYYMYAKASHESYKATYDCLIPEVRNF